MSAKSKKATKAKQTKATDWNHSSPDERVALVRSAVEGKWMDQLGRKWLIRLHLQEMRKQALSGDEGAAKALIEVSTLGCEILEGLFKSSDPKVRSALEKASARSDRFPLLKKISPLEHGKPVAEQMELELPIGEDLLKIPKRIAKDEVTDAVLHAVWIINTIRLSSNEADGVAEAAPFLAEWVSEAAALPPLSTDGDVLSRWADAVIDLQFLMYEGERRTRPVLALFSPGSPLNEAANPAARAERIKPTLEKEIDDLCDDLEHGKSGRDELMIEMDIVARVNRIRSLETEPEGIKIGLRKKFRERLETIARG